MFIRASGEQGLANSGDSRFEDGCALPSIFYGRLPLSAAHAS